MNKFASVYFRLVPALIGILAISLISFFLDKKQGELDRFFDQSTSNYQDQRHFNILFGEAQSLSIEIHQLRKWNNYIIFTLSLYCIFLLLIDIRKPDGRNSN